ncbi:RNA polymerase sigma factor SigJ [Streptomyces sp. NPDC002667]|uniref:RNA polymerase sigma factor SigJ n=1 Tax=Streptomyces sp. NPDC002667 TaxID=3364657 RepID=UPI0036780E47
MTDAVAQERPWLTNVAYRMLGSLAEAEDAVQESLARWYALTPGQRANVASPRAWLTTVTGRVCLDVLGSARARRERYVGDWVPEPLPDASQLPGTGAETTDPADQIVLDESVDMAFLVVLEALTPAERVVFVLHDVFQYPFNDVAAIVERSPAACRQLASSGRRRVRAVRSAPVPSAEQAGIIREFKQAWEQQDIPALVGLLDPRAVMVTDGGGLVSATLRPVEGAARIARYITDIGVRAPGMELRVLSVNGRPGLVALRGDLTVNVAAFEIADGRITRIWGVRNPEKLRAWNERVGTEQGE